MMVHLISDEKFIDHVISSWQKNCPPHHRLVFLMEQSSDVPIQHISTSSMVHIQQKENAFSFLQALKEEADQKIWVVVHNLFEPWKKKLLRQLDPAFFHIHWISWGADLYQWTLSEQRLYGKNTQYFRLFKTFTPNTLLRWAAPFMLIGYEKWKQRKQRKLWKDVLVNIHSATTILPFEQEEMNRLLKRNLPFFPFHYTSAERISQQVGDTIVTGSSFLLGNSAHPSNNHYEALSWLRQFIWPKWGAAASPSTGRVGQHSTDRSGQPSTDREGAQPEKSLIICPLSYGNQRHAQAVETVGMTWFSNSFVPLRQFLPPDQYGEIMDQCRFFLLFTFRQQALGNILQALWKGMVVVFPPQNPMYRYFKEKGYQVFTTDELVNRIDRNEFSTIPSPVVLARLHRPLLKEHFSEQVVDQQIQTFFQAAQHPRQ